MEAEGGSGRRVHYRGNTFFVVRQLVCRDGVAGPGFADGGRRAGDAEAGRVRIEIRDYGVGLTEGRRERIFERFYRAEVRRYYGGMGIGLYVSRQITEMQGGTLWVEQPVGGGSLYVVRLPLRGEPAGSG